MNPGPQQLAEELHKPQAVRAVKQFRKVITGGLDDVWTMDFVFVYDKDAKVVKENHGYKYIHMYGLL